MNVLRHWLVYRGGEPQVIRDEQTASERIAARETVFGPFVLELPQPQGAVDALREIREIAAREWAADETNYEWYGDIAGIAETALNLPIGGSRR